MLSTSLYWAPDTLFGSSSGWRFMRFRWMVSVSGGALFAVLLAQSGASQQRVAETASAGDWPMYRHDLAGTGYSPLSQINTRNVANLSRVWVYRLQGDVPTAAAAGGRGGPGGVNSEVTPIVVNGVMYLPAANRVVALEPETGKEIWRHLVAGGAPSRRGVAYWPGDGGNPRIIFTAGRRLVALNAKTGALDTGFGKEGEVDMLVPYNSVPLVYKNVVVVGANTPAGAIRGQAILELFDARTGGSSGNSARAAAGPGRARHVGRR
jgi:quinoprotein glucose dehydrogenase